MTTPHIKTDHDVVNEAAAELRGAAGTITAVADTVASTAATAASEPLPAGSTEGPEVAVLAAAVGALELGD